MAKFCTNCGKQLKDGEVCDCKKSQAKEEKIVGVPVNGSSSQASDIFNEVVADAKGIFVKPIDTIKENNDDSKFIKGIVLTVILSVATGLCCMALVGLLISWVSTLYSSLLGGYSLYGSTGSLTSEVDYGEVFLKCTAATFVLTFIYSGLLYLVNTVIFKAKAGFKATYSLYGVTSIIETAGLLVSALLTKLEITTWAICLWPMLAASVLTTAYRYHMIKFIGPKDENKHGYIYLLTYVLYIVVVAILAKLFG